MGTTITFERAFEIAKAGGADLLSDDRRTNDRARFLKHIRVRSVEPSGVEEVATMIDLSRDGLYFTARSHDYHVGMELRLNLPATDSEWACEVVRTEMLPNGNLGIGVRLLR